MPTDSSLNILVEFTAAIVAPMSLGMLLDYYCSARHPAIWNKLRAASETLEKASLLTLHQKLAGLLVHSRIFQYGYIIGTVKYGVVLCFGALWLLSSLDFVTPGELSFHASMRVCLYGFLLMLLCTYCGRRFTQWEEGEAEGWEVSKGSLGSLLYRTAWIVWRMPRAAGLIAEGKINGCFGIFTKLKELAASRKRPRRFLVIWTIVLVVPIYLLLVICIITFATSSMVLFAIFGWVLLDSFGVLDTFLDTSIISIVLLSFFLDAASLWVTIRLLRVVARSGALLSIVIIGLDVVLAIGIATIELFLSFFMTLDVHTVYIDSESGELTEGPHPVWTWVLIASMTALVPTLCLAFAVTILALMKIGQSLSYGFARFVLNLMALKHDKDTARPFTTIGALGSGFILIRFYVYGMLFS